MEGLIFGIFPNAPCVSDDIESSGLSLAQRIIVFALSSLSSAGQNESGVAVHDDRIYVVGGYSICTNEPLACIQVSDLDRFK